MACRRRYCFRVWGLVDRYMQRVGESTNHRFTKCAVRQEAGFSGGYRERARASSWVRELPNLDTSAPSRFLNPSSPPEIQKPILLHQGSEETLLDFLCTPALSRFPFLHVQLFGTPFPLWLPFSSPLPCCSSSSQRKAQEIESATTQPRGGDSLAVCRPIICVPTVPRARPL